MDFRSALLLSSLTLFAATPTMAMKSAAPDAGGYSFIDNHEAGGPSYNFEDISATGTPFSLGDDTTYDIALPFNFTFYGNTYASVRVSSNGFISFDPVGSGCCTGQPIPQNDSWDNLIAAWWEDLDPAYCGGASQQWQVVGSAPNRRLIIQHNYTPAFYCAPGDNTFQYKLFEGSNTVEVHYQSLTSGDSGTFSIGIEAPAGATGHQVYRGSGTTPPYSSNWAIRYSSNVYGLNVSSGTIVTNESGALGEFTLALLSAPASDVTVTLAISDATEGQLLTPTTYTFTPANWSVPQTIQLEGVDDQYSDGDKSYAISASWSSADPDYNDSNNALVSVTNVDDESAGFNVSGAPFATSEDGSTAQLIITLNTEVAGTITVPVNVSDSSEASLSTTQLVFDSGHLSQTITVTGLDDGIADGDVPYLLQLGSAVTNNTEDAGYTGMAFGSYNATNLDDDVAGFNVDTSMTGTTSERGRSTTFTMALSSEPEGDVTVTFGVSDTAEATITPSITFTAANWMTPQTVTVTGLDDGTADGDKQYTVTYQIASADAAYSGRAIPELDELVLVNKENTDVQQLEELTSNLTPPSSNSGGGALNPLLLLAMGGLFLVRRRRVN